jgi:hypothetical protein
VVFIQHRRLESNTAYTAIWHQEFFHCLKNKIILVGSPQHNITCKPLSIADIPDENQRPDALTSVACSSAYIWDRNLSVVEDSHELPHFPPKVSVSASGSCAYVQVSVCASVTVCASYLYALMYTNAMYIPANRTHITILNCKLRPFYRIL